MDAERFLDALKEPHAWYRKSSELRRAAHVVWSSYQTELDTDRRMGFLTSASLLYAMSIEAALKGRLLETRPEEVRVTVETDGTGAIRRALIQKMEGLNHDLVPLADRLGLIGNDSGRRKLLQSLTNCLVWIGRYPVPRGVGEGALPASVSIMVQNLSVRVIIDQLLDELLGHDARDDE